MLLLLLLSVLRLHVDYTGQTIPDANEWEMKDDTSLRHRESYLSSSYGHSDTLSIPTKNNLFR